STAVAGSVGLYGAFTEEGTAFPKAGAYYTKFYYGNDWTTSKIAPLDWLIGKALLYVNSSQGINVPGPTSPVGAHIDWTIRTNHVLLTWATPDNANFMVDCEDWNLLCVGAYNYHVWNDRSDDRVSTFSSYLNNPTLSATAERPHLVGPGESLTTP